MFERELETLFSSRADSLRNYPVKRRDNFTVNVELEIYGATKALRQISYKLAC